MLSNHRFIFPPTRFSRTDKVVDISGNEGYVSQVYVSYPARGDFADWTSPEIIYQVSFLNGAKTLHREGELTDFIQTQLPFKVEESDSKSNQEAWNYEQL